MNDLEPIDRELAAGSVEARTQELKRFARSYKGDPEDFPGLLARFIEEEIQLATIDLERRTATVNRIQTDSRWRRVAQVWEHSANDIAAGLDVITKLWKANERRADAYATLLNREVNAGRLKIGADELAKLGNLERAQVAIQLDPRTESAFDRLVDAENRVKNVQLLRDQLLDELKSRRQDETELQSEFLGRIR